MPTLTISQLIAELEAIKQQHGDLPTFTSDQDGIQYSIRPDLLEVLEAHPGEWAGIVWIPEQPKRLVI